jgi:hypothetical protein
LRLVPTALSMAVCSFPFRGSQNLPLHCHMLQITRLQMLILNDIRPLSQQILSIHQERSRTWVLVGFQHLVADRVVAQWVIASIQAVGCTFRRCHGLHRCRYLFCQHQWNTIETKHYLLCSTPPRYAVTSSL